MGVDCTAEGERDREEEREVRTDRERGGACHCRSLRIHKSERRNKRKQAGLFYILCKDKLQR